MPFIKGTEKQQSQPLSDIRTLFIGRTNELHFFIECILKPLEPTHNIVSISGNGGVGKSTLLKRYIEEVHSDDFRDYCQIALVDERQTTPIAIMEKFADQLNLSGEFDKSLAQYRESWLRLQRDGESSGDAFLRKAPDLAGTVVEDVPVIGGLLKEGATITTKYLVNKYNAQHIARDLKRFDDPLTRLTRAFINDLNHLAETQVLLPSERIRRPRRILLCFDTFEQMAEEANPWLLEHFLEANINSNIVLIFAGRTPVERTVAPDPLSWKRYSNESILYPIVLSSFSRDEANIYLMARGITDPQRLEIIWYLSRGLPLYLSLLTSNPQGEVDPTADVVANFLRWIPRQDDLKRRLALDASLFSRPFNQDDLAIFSYLPVQEIHAYHRWLISQPFVRIIAQNGRHNYHDLARELFQRHMYQLSPNESHATRRLLAEHYLKQIDKSWQEIGAAIYNTSEWSELTLALAQQCFYLPDKNSHTLGIEQILRIFRRSEQKNEVTHCLRELADEGHSNMISPPAREVIQLLLQYIEIDSTTQAYLDVSSQLIKRVGNEPTFP
ncbi:MAG TPA: hypothetical protein VFN23_13200, partial [Ktedonobacteraceae bacterium]|nr:hypothetical protein [Ktedonobacteraceae bacterium]